MILAIDAGTTSIRGILYSLEAEPELVLQVETAPCFLPDGNVEQDPSVWKNALLKILSAVGSRFTNRNDHLEAIGLTAFRSAVFPMDENGNTLAQAVMWQDRRCDAICERLESCNDEIYVSSGLPVASMFSAVKILWFQEQCPDIFVRTWKFSGIYEYLLFLLTGNFITDYSVASRTNLFNIEECRWDTRLLDIFGIGRKYLAEIVPPGTICGSLRKDLANEFHLPNHLPIVAAGGDQQCALLGMTGGMGSALNTGTGAYIFAHSLSRAQDPGKRIHTNIAALPDRFIIETGIPAAGSLCNWFARLFLPVGRNSHFNVFAREIQAVPPGVGGLLCIPDFTIPYGGGAFINLDLNASRGSLARALLEGIALDLKDCLTIFESCVGRTDNISASGGLSRLPIYNQILADILDRNIVVSIDEEASARGAWLNTLNAIGKPARYKSPPIRNNIEKCRRKSFYKPRYEYRKIYDRLAKKRREIRDRLIQ